MILIVGMGQTGFSVARFLARKKIEFTIADTRQSPPLLAQFKQHFIDKKYHLGELNQAILNNIDTIVLSPGVAKNEPFIERAQQKGIRIIGDITLFFQYVNAPVIGITGSNGKSTVSQLVFHFMKKVGLTVRLGGNIGIPALDCLDKGVDFYVLELSSYQLDLTPNMPLAAATVLNIAPDHLERYASFDDYAASKLSIFTDATHQVVNSDEPYAQQINEPLITYGLNRQDDKRPNFSRHQQSLMVDGEAFMNIVDIPLMGEFNQLNILAAYALCSAVGLGGVLKQHIVDAVNTAVLPQHRLAFIGQVKGVDYYNDSKATNTHAACAGITTLSQRYGYLVLIIGGELKQEDYGKFNALIEQCAHSVVVLAVNDGEAIQFFTKQINKTPVLIAHTMTAAVRLAAAAFNNLAVNDKQQMSAAVCLSPACASFDLFSSFVKRGEAFIEAVEGLSG